MANPSIQTVTATFGQILFSGRLSTTAVTTVYTVPASKTVKIAQATLCNPSGAAVDITFAVLKVGDTDDGTHTILATTVQPKDTIVLKDYIGGSPLGEGEALSVSASTANVICVVITGAVSS